MIKLTESTESIRGVPMQIVDTHVVSSDAPCSHRRQARDSLSLAKVLTGKWELGSGK